MYVAILPQTGNHYYEETSVLVSPGHFWGRTQLSIPGSDPEKWSKVGICGYPQNEVPQGDFYREMQEDELLLPLLTSPRTAQVHLKGKNDDGLIASNGRVGQKMRRIQICG